MCCTWEPLEGVGGIAGAFREARQRVVSRVRRLVENGRPRVEAFFPKPCVHRGPWPVNTKWRRWRLRILQIALSTDGHCNVVSRDYGEKRMKSKV